VNQNPGDVTEQTLTISNDGPVPMDFEISTGAAPTLRIVSDGSWRVSATSMPGWETIGFDDSSWDFTVSPAPVACGWVNCGNDPDVFTMWASDQHQTIYLRKSFVLASSASVISATIKTTCDDDHDLYVNGTLVASDWNGSAGPELVTDIEAHLLTGVNVIAVKANDTAGGCRWMCVDAVINVEPADWLSTDPVSGTVPAHSSAPVEVTFDATGMEPGDHPAEIVILSNDPVTPSVVVPVEMAVNNLPPEVTLTPETQEVQYSDLIDDITIEALDNVAEVLNASTTWSSDGSSFSPGLPAGLALTGPSCSDDGVFQTCSWDISGAMSEPAGTYAIRAEVSDGYGGTTVGEIQLTVDPEDAEIWLDNDNPATIQVDTSVGYSPAFSLAAYVREIVPDAAGFGAEPGDISNAEVEMTLAAVGPGSSYTVVCSNVAVTGVGYEQILEVGCGFDGVEVNTYHVQTTVVGGYYTGAPAEAILVVFDPSLDSTAGSGWFYWPDTEDAASGYLGDKTTFGYVMKYNQKSQQVNGSLLLIRHVGDGSGPIYRVKSNVLTGLSLGEAGAPVFGWASFNGKCTYKDKDWVASIGNHGFLVYVEDHGEPGRDADEFWMEVYDKDGDVIVAMSMDRDASENTETLSGGNILVPHGAE
jgi:hypothetical protein